MKVGSENKYHLYDNDKTSQISFNKHPSDNFEAERKSNKNEVQTSGLTDPRRRLSVIKESTEEINDKGSPVKIKKITEQKKEQIDDVYDEKVFLDDHQLYTLRAGNALNFMALMEMTGFCACDFHKGNDHVSSRGSIMSDDGMKQFSPLEGKYSNKEFKCGCQVDCKQPTPITAKN